MAAGSPVPAGTQAGSRPQPGSLSFAGPFGSLRLKGGSVLGDAFLVTLMDAVS